MKRETRKALLRRKKILRDRDNAPNMRGVTFRANWHSAFVRVHRGVSSKPLANHLSTVREFLFIVVTSASRRNKTSDDGMRNRFEGDRDLTFKTATFIRRAVSIFARIFDTRHSVFRPDSRDSQDISVIKKSFQCVSLSASRKSRPRK